MASQTGVDLGAVTEQYVVHGCCGEEKRQLVTIGRLLQENRVVQELVGILGLPAFRWGKHPGPKESPQ